MSRTRKDRPYWVIMNDRSLGTVEDHDHREVRYRPTQRVTNYGEKTLVPYGEPRWFLRHTNGIPGMTIEEDIDARAPYSYWFRSTPDPMFVRSTNLRWYYEQPMRYEYVGRTVKYFEPHTETCDIDIPIRSSRDLWRNNCTVEPLWHRQPHTRSRLDTESRKDLNRAYRRSSGPAMRKMVKEYNADHELDDSQWQDFKPALFDGWL